MPRRSSKKFRSRGPGLFGWLCRIFVAGLLVLAVMVVWAFVRTAAIDVDSLATHDPVSTAIMRQRAREAREAGKPWHPSWHRLPYERISPHLRRAVLIAEDDAFYSHDGLDWNEIKQSARKDIEKLRIVRGGSTITQQLAKNLWLGTSRSPVRKIEEVMLAVRLEHALSKKRIFELYLNVIEWGDGVFGAEAAARHWFHVPASALGARASVRLAAVIINPRRFSPIAPPRRIERRVRIIAGRMHRRGELSDADYRETLGLPPAPPASPAPAESGAGTPAAGR
jgi:monofunctional biosynthetic peptidoglycan transglycosylase